jgi:hypothetical protein
MYKTRIGPALKLTLASFVIGGLGMPQSQAKFTCDELYNRCVLHCNIDNLPQGPAAMMACRNNCGHQWKSCFAGGAGRNIPEKLQTPPTPPKPKSGVAKPGGGATQK